jgi:hypothetical protein
MLLPCGVQAHSNKIKGRQCERHKQHLGAQQSEIAVCAISLKLMSGLSRCTAAAVQSVSIKYNMESPCRSSLLSMLLCVCVLRPSNSQIRTPTCLAFHRLAHLPGVLERKADDMN